MACLDRDETNTRPTPESRRCARPSRPLPGTKRDADRRRPRLCGRRRAARPALGHEPAAFPRGRDPDSQPGLPHFRDDEQSAKRRPHPLPAVPGVRFPAADRGHRGTDHASDQCADAELALQPARRCPGRDLTRPPRGAGKAARPVDHLGRMLRAFTYDVPHVSPARFDSDVPGEARVFTSLTLSKTYGLTGLRIGALICPPGLERKMNNIMESIVSCVASPSQYAALAALTGPQDYVSSARAHYRANRDAASAMLRSRGIRYLTPKARFICGRTCRMPATGMSGPGTSGSLSTSAWPFCPARRSVRSARAGSALRSAKNYSHLCGGPRPPPCTRIGHRGLAGTTDPVAGASGARALNTRRSQLARLA